MEYLGFTTQPADVADTTLYLRVHWANRDGRAVVVGLDLRTFWSSTENGATQAILRAGLDVQPMGEVNTAVLRGLRFADVVEEGSRKVLEESLIEAPPPEDDDARAQRAALARAVAAGKRRRGPRPAASDEDLERFVAAPYRAHLTAGGRKPVQAAREAMQASGRFGAAVTSGMASKAVERARRLGMIPPAERRGKP